MFGGDSDDGMGGDEDMGAEDGALLGLTSNLYSHRLTVYRVPTQNLRRGFNGGRKSIHAEAEQPFKNSRAPITHSFSLPRVNGGRLEVRPTMLFHTIAVASRPRVEEKRLRPSNEPLL